MKKQIVHWLNASIYHLPLILILGALSTIISSVEAAVIYHKPNSQYFTNVSPDGSGGNLSLSFGPSGNELSLNLTVGSPSVWYPSPQEAVTEYLINGYLVTPSDRGSYGVGHLDSWGGRVGHYPLPYVAGSLIHANLDNWYPTWLSPVVTVSVASPLSIGYAGYDHFAMDGEPNLAQVYSYGMFSVENNSTIEWDNELNWPEWYYPIRFLIDDDYCFGYARFTFFATTEGSIGTAGIVLHDWAYESSPNTPIAAGAVPEPSISVFFSVILGYGLLARRRKLCR